MKKPDPDLTLARPVNLLDPAFWSFASSQLLGLWSATDVANIYLDDRGECGARIGWLTGGRRGLGGMRGCVLRHARSIGANESGSNFRTGWAVGWVVSSSNPGKLLKELVGASGFEPPTSWSRTRRSSQAEPRPEEEISTHSNITRRVRAHSPAALWEATEEAVC